MYINKNKGILLIENLVSLVILVIIFSSLFILYKNLSEDKRSYKNFLINKNNLERVEKFIQQELDISLSYKIMNYTYSLPITLYYPEESLEAGNLLLIERGEIINGNVSKKIDGFYCVRDLIQCIPGKKEGDIVYFYREKTEEFEKQFIKGKFVLTDFGIELEGKYRGEEIIIEFKE